MKSEYTVERVNKFVNLLPRKSFDRPAKKFVRELLVGIVIAQSLVVTSIARALAVSNKDFRSIYKRILRRLGEVDLAPAKEQQQERAYREIADQTIIAIDLGDITKPCSKTLECLGFVADGSDKHRVKPGYGLLGAVAINPKTQDKTPEPLELQMYSPGSEEWISENHLLKTFIDDVYMKSGGKGTHVIDRGGDRGIILKHYFELTAPFIIRMNNRHLTDIDRQVIIKTKDRQIHRDSLPFESMICREANEGNQKRATMHIRYDFAKVTVTNLEKKVPHECWLVTAWALGHRHPIQLLTNKSVLSWQDALEIIVGYLSRWSVEETYRFMKTGMGLEELRCFSFAKLKNLVHAIFLAASLIARMSRFSSWQTVFKRVALRLKKAPDVLYNWFYRAADACSILFKKHLTLLLAENQPVLHRRKPRLVQGTLFDDEWSM